MVKREAWEKVDLAPYIGEWVIIEGDKVLAHDKDLSKIGHLVDSCKGIPTLIRIPKGNIHLFPCQEQPTTSGGGLRMQPMLSPKSLVLEHAQKPRAIPERKPSVCA